MSDVWEIEDRGKAVGIYTLMPLLGPGKPVFIHPIDRR
jgi:hypothetical protein